MRMHIPTVVYSEDSCVLNHADALRGLGTKAMLVTGRHSAVRTGAQQDVIEALGDIPFVIFNRIEENPSVETVMEARKIAMEEQVDFFVGIGGGSPMDAAKAISLMAANPQEDETVLYTARALPYFPIACVPTTCGTGSEVTPYAILTRHAHRTKKSISHRIFPELALLDARYLKTMSRAGLINTCVDALAHLLESYLNTNSDELNRVYSREGLALWARFRDALLVGAETPEDYANMLHASMLAGMAIAHTGTSVPHGMSYPVTYSLGVPHGRAVGIFLGGFVKSYGNQEEAKAALEILGFSDSVSFCDYLHELLGAVPVPGELVETAADLLLDDPAKLKNYPFPIDAEGLKMMLQQP